MPFNKIYFPGSLQNAKKKMFVFTKEKLLSHGGHKIGKIIAPYCSKQRMYNAQKKNWNTRTQTRSENNIYLFDSSNIKRLLACYWKEVDDEKKKIFLCEILAGIAWLWVCMWKERKIFIGARLQSLHWIFRTNSLCELNNLYKLHCMWIDLKPFLLIYVRWFSDRI